MVMTTTTEEAMTTTTEEAMTTATKVQLPSRLGGKGISSGGRLALIYSLCFGIPVLLGGVGLYFIRDHKLAEIRQLYWIDPQQHPPVTPTFAGRYIQETAVGL
jgi:hypothetical protein